MADMQYSEAYLAESRAVDVTVVSWVCTGVATLTVALKLFTTVHIRKTIGWDDYFVFLSLVFSILASACVEVSVDVGLGRHVAWLLQQGFEQLAKCAFWQSLGFPFNILAFSFPNVSIAILIERLLDPNVPRRIVMYIMVWMQVLFAFVAVVLYFAQCSPVQHLWDSGRVPGTCWDPNVFFNYYYFFSAYTALVDLILAVVPITAFWQLQMKQSTRMGLCLMMALTLLSAVVTVAKTCYIPLLARKDLLYDVIPLVQWGLVEQNVVIMAACVPTLRPFFSAFGGTLRSGASASDPKGAPSYGSTVRSRDRFSSTAQVRLESSQSEVELNDVEAVKSAACDADAKRQELHSSAGSSGDDAGTLNGCNITRTVQVNVDVRDRKGPAESKVKAYW